MIQRLSKWIGQLLDAKGNKTAYSEELITETRQMLTRFTSARLDPTTCLKEMTFVVFDTETTGFHPYAGDELLSIGAVVVRAGRVVEAESFHEWINPNREVPQHILELLQVTEDEVTQAAFALEVINRFLQFVQSSCLVAHNLDFDLHFLNKPLKTYCKQKLQHPAIDTMMVAYHLFPTLGSHSLDRLLEVFQIPVGKRHYALDDALMTAKLFVKLLDVLEERGVHSWVGLEHYLRRHSLYGSL